MCFGAASSNRSHKVMARISSKIRTKIKTPMQQLDQVSVVDALVNMTLRCHRRDTHVLTLILPDHKPNFLHARL